MSTMMTTNVQALASSESAALILGPLLDEGLGTRPEIAQVAQTGATEYRVPVVRAGAAAAWVREGEEITPSGLDLEELIITPAKLAGLVPISRELAEDSAPSAVEEVGRSLATSVIFHADAALLGNAEAPGPEGLAHQDGVQEIDGGGLDSLDPLHAAKTEIAVAGGTATSIVAHPRDILRLAQLKDADGSNRGLVEDTTTVVGLPLFPSAHATEGTIWVLDSQAITTVIRSTVEVESSRDVYFSSDRIAVRATARMAYGFAYPERLARITISG